MLVEYMAFYEREKADLKREELRLRVRKPSRVGHEILYEVPTDDQTITASEFLNLKNYKIK